MRHHCLGGRLAADAGANRRRDNQRSPRPDSTPRAANVARRMLQNSRLSSILLATNAPANVPKNIAVMEMLNAMIGNRQPSRSTAPSHNIASIGVPRLHRARSASGETGSSYGQSAHALKSAAIAERTDSGSAVRAHGDRPTSGAVCESEVLPNAPTGSSSPVMNTIRVSMLRRPGMSNSLDEQGAASSAAARTKSTWATGAAAACVWLPYRPWRHRRPAACAAIRARRSRPAGPR